MSENSLLEIDYPFVRDISKEPRVKPQDAPRKELGLQSLFNTLWKNICAFSF